jgi:hypothetical protein
MRDPLNPLSSLVTLGPAPQAVKVGWLSQRAVRCPWPCSCPGEQVSSGHSHHDQPVQPVPFQERGTRQEEAYNNRVSPAWPCLPKQVPFEQNLEGGAHTAPHPEMGSLPSQGAFKTLLSKFFPPLSFDMTHCTCLCTLCTPVPYP